MRRKADAFLHCTCYATLTLPRHLARQTAAFVLQPLFDISDHDRGKAGKAVCGTSRQLRLEQICFANIQVSLFAARARRCAHHGGQIKLGAIVALLAQRNPHMTRADAAGGGDAIIYSVCRLIPTA